MHIPLDPHRQTIAQLDLGDMLALLVHQEIGNINRAFHQHLAGATARALLLDLAQDGQGHAVIGPDQTGAMTGRARLGAGLQHAGAQPLAAHLQQAKAGNTAHLNARPVGFQLVFQTLLNRVVVLALVHVDEIDHDQTSQIAQPQLARHLFGSLQIGLQRRLLDRALFRGPTRVHVNRHQRLGHADHDISTGFQLHRGVEHPRQVTLHLIAREQWQAVLIPFHVLGVGRHDHLHEILGDAIAAFAFDQNLINIAVIKIADRPFDQVAFLIDLGRRNGFQRQFADLFPHPLQVFVIALDLGLGALGTRRAHDQTRALGHINFVRYLFEFLAICGIGDLAADAATARGIGHQDAIPARKAQICGQRRTLVATLFLDNLHQKNLAHLDDFLDLVTTRTRLARGANIFAVILLGHGFDGVILGGCIRTGVAIIFVICLRRRVTAVVILRLIGGGRLYRRFGHRFHRG